MEKSTTEKFHLEVLRFRTPEGQPTCSIGPTAKDTCMFYRNTALQIELCSIVTAKAGGRYVGVIHRDKEGLGYMIPHKECPIWNGGQSED